MSLFLASLFLLQVQKHNIFTSFSLFLTFLLAFFFWLCWVFVAVRAFLQLWRVAVTLQLRCTDFSSQWLLSLQIMGSTACGLQQLRPVDSRAQAHWLWHVALVAPLHVGPSWTRDGTGDSCIGRWILYQGSPYFLLIRTLVITLDPSR